MAEITKAFSGLASVEPPQNDTHVGILAGDTIAAGDFVYISNSSGSPRLTRATGAAVNAAALAVGIVMTGATNGRDAPTVFANVEVKYATGLTPGTRLYISGTVAGGLADAASTGGTVPVAYVVDATRIKVLACNR
jgi:hypothetical protein